ncbi:hypothetical protein IMZ48_37055 [Candidatus Bathyarchaeota archaeon]|nr:hypothetical protein [Candidatus Bathyarchaeota archaeon]
MADQSPEKTAKTPPHPATPNPRSPVAGEKRVRTSPSPGRSSPTSPADENTAKTPPPLANPGSSSPAGDNSPIGSPSPPAAASPAGILPAHHWAQVRRGTPVGPGDALLTPLPQEPVEGDDAESAYGEPSNLSTSSITSSILNYRTLHGRRYHSEVGNAAYW